MRVRAPAGLAPIIATLLASVAPLGAASAAPGHPAPLLLGGAGGVYFLADAGPLVVEVFKRDRNRRGSPAELRAILFGPDRRVLAEARIPDDGLPRGKGMGPIQSATLSVTLPAKGVCGLIVTVSQDRYGDEALWGFRSNCPKQVIETARGHRDERHQEPIILRNDEDAANVCFLPRRGAIAIEVQHAGHGDSVRLLDSSGKTLKTLPITGGNAAAQIAADIPRDSGPWNLVIPKGESVLHIDGVTRWDKGDPFPDMACWSPRPDAWFPLLENHWLLTPYRKILYREPGARDRVTFRLSNGASRERTINLSVEFPEAEWPASLARERVTLPAGKSTEVTLSFVAPPDGKRRACHLRATPADDPDFSTFSTLEIHGGASPATRPLRLPLTLRPFEHENEQFGYLPDYPRGGEIYFDLGNRPFTLDGGHLATTCPGGWTNLPILAASGSAVPSPERQPFSPVGTKIAFDRTNGLYLLGSAGSRRALLHSRDGGMTFTAWALPPGEARASSFDIEQFSGHNVPDGPPPIARYSLTATDPKLFWRRVHDIELLLPSTDGDRIHFAAPVLISTQGIGLAMHSGIPATLASRGDRTHICWGEATDPAAPVPGVPAFVATYARGTGLTGPPALIGYGAPPNDIHNTPTLTIDGRGTLHALGGTHGKPFPYAASLEPNDAARGWTPPSATGPDLPQTYIGLVCGPDGTLHGAFRLWQRNREPFPLSHHATLAYQRKRPGQDWEMPKVLIVPPLSEYSVFYHRLTIDRKGRLFLSYDYWSTFWFYRNDHAGRRRSLLMSDDGGDSWRLATTSDIDDRPGHRGP